MKMNRSEHMAEPTFKTTLPTKLKKLKSIDDYSKEELYEQLIQLQKTAFDAQKEIKAENEQLLEYFLLDQYNSDDLQKAIPSFVGIHQKLFQAAYKLKMDTLHLESRFDSLEKEIAERQEALLVHEYNLSAIIENTPDHIFSLNRDLEILLANSKGYDFAKEFFDFEMTPGTYLPIHLPREVSSELEPRFRDALEGKASQIFLPVRKGDKEIFFQISINPIFNQEDEVEGISCLARDITDQEAQKKKVRQQQDLIYSISKNIQEGIFRTTREEGIQYINQAFVDMFGYASEDELKQINLDNLYADPNQRQEIVSYMENNTYFINKEVLFKRKNGSTFWGLMSSTKLENAHGEAFFDGAIRDVSQIKETRESLKKKNEALDKFVWSTSHDLRAPLVSILGLIDVAKMGSKDEQVNRYMDLMEVSVQKLLNFIHDIIDYAQNNNVKIEVVQVNLKDLIQETFDSFQYLENAPSIDFRIIERGAQTFYSDRKRLSIILKNLLSNAINYADLSKEKPSIRIEIHNSRKEISFCVKDNGIGIQEDSKDKVFDMFYRGTKRSTGSGIGLYIVKEAVRKLDGRIELDSTEGEGSSFCIHLANLAPRDPRLKREEPQE